jgi:polyhydroxyalkanoate synthesis repressor PhaR
MTEQETEQVRIIKKYPNRRLYDTEESRYITLPEVRELVVKNTPMKVVDTNSGEDITRNILLQIIIEQESDNDPLFSNDNLQNFIRYYSDTSHKGFSMFIDRSLHFFQDQQEAIQSQMKDLMAGGSPMKFWSDLGESNIELWKNMQNDFFSAMGVNTKKEK